MNKTELPVIAFTKELVSIHEIPKCTDLFSPEELLCFSPSNKLSYMALQHLPFAQVFSKKKNLITSFFSL